MIPYLSQSQLKLLETCPRKFQHVFIDGLPTPPNIEGQESMEWGSRFHLLMQQRELGLSVNSFLEADDRLSRWFENFVSAAPELFADVGETAFRQAERDISLEFDDFLLLGRYDLFVADDRAAKILDWKTYPRPKNRAVLAKDWQTRLYLFLLAETSDYPPDAISMTYWFANSQPQAEPQYLSFAYDSKQHQRIKKELRSLLDKLENWLQDYDNGIPFPMVAETDGACDRCTFSSRCDRDTDSLGEGSTDAIADISSIEEVVI